MFGLKYSLNLVCVHLRELNLGNRTMFQFIQRSTVPHWNVGFMIFGWLIPKLYTYDGSASEYQILIWHLHGHMLRDRERQGGIGHISNQELMQCKLQQHNYNEKISVVNRQYAVYCVILLVSRRNVQVSAPPTPFFSYCDWQLTVSLMCGRC